MKILVVALNAAPELTGIGKYVGEMVEWLDAHGAEVRVVAAPPYYPQWRVGAGYSGWRYVRERRGTAVVIRCPLYVPRRPDGARRLLHLASFALSSLPVLLWTGLRWRPDVIFLVEPPLACAPGALLAARLGRARAWLHVQDFEVDAAFALRLLHGPAARGALSWLERWLLGRFDRVSTISPAMDERLAGKGVPAGRRAMFPNWVDTEAIHPLATPVPLRAELGVGDDVCVVLYSGALGRKQGLDLLIEAARRLPASPPIRILICGDGGERAALQASARDVECVRFLPLQPAERLNELLNAADVHVLPQRGEAEDLVMPSKLAPMLASGRPVVATARPDSEVARAIADRGVLVAPGDPEALAAALVALARDPDRRRALGARARRHAVEHWDRATVLEQVLGRELGVLTGRTLVPAARPGDRADVRCGVTQS